MDIEPSLALRKRQIVGRDAYGTAISLMPPSNRLWEFSCNLIVENWNSRGASKPWAWIGPQWMEVYVVDNLAKVDCQRLLKIWSVLVIVILVATGAYSHQ